ncbi:putative TPR repeat-containing protein PA4667 [Gammaproteobacteria bacterium]
MAILPMLSRIQLPALLLSLALAMAGCQVAPRASSPLLSSPVLTLSAPLTLQDTVLKGTARPADLAFEVLAGEIAIQRKLYGEAAQHYFRATQLSRQAYPAERATQTAVLARNEPLAREAAELWIEIDPQSALARQLAVGIYIRAGDLDRAEQHLRHLVALAKQAQGQGYIEAAKAVARSGEVEPAITLMTRLAHQSPTQAEVHFALAIVALAAKRFDLAQQSVNRALTLKPHWSEAEIFMSRLLTSQGHREAALRHLEQAVANQPRDRILALALARELVEDKHYPRAYTLFRKLLEQRPKDEDLLLSLAAVAFEIGKKKEAQGYFERLARGQEHRDEALFLLGQIAEEAGDRRAAINWYRQVDGGRLVESRVALAKLKAEEGATAEAQEILQQLRGDHPTGADRYFLIEADLLRKTKLYERAALVYDQALAAFPDDLDLRYARAMNAVSLNRLDLLEQDLKAILAKNPNHLDAINALGYVLADRTDRLQEALGYLTKAFALKPDNPAVQDSLGWLYFRLGRQAEALTLLEQAYAKLKDPEVGAHLGEVLWSQGQVQRAQTIWNELLAHEPDNDYLRATIQRLSPSQTVP